MRRLGRAVALAVLWLSPAALLGLPPAILADGTRGLVAPLALAVGAALVALLLGDLEGGRLEGGATSVSGLARIRWPEADGPVRLLAAVDLSVTVLFAWAQFAAVREVSRALDWAPWWPVLTLAAGLALAVSRPARDARAAQVAGVLALVAWLLPLAAVLATTTVVWPRVWRDTASRPGFVFREASPWVSGGREVRGRTGDEATIAFTDEQRLLLLGRGSVRVDYWEGGQTRQDVTERTEVTLRSGDRLTIPGGFPIRFQIDRRIPGAPSSGPDWIDPPGARADWRVLLGLGLTLGLGWLGCPAILALLPVPTPMIARLGAGIAVSGVAAVLLWALYAAWLAPEIFVGGVGGVEVYELPRSVPGLTVPAGRVLTSLALSGLLILGAVTIHGALRGLAVPTWGVGGRGRPTAIVVTAVAAGLAVATGAAPWVVLLVALGVAAAAGTPAVLLTCWSERASARGVATGAAVGLVLYGVLAILGAAKGIAPGRPVSGTWTTWVLGWPVVVALPLAALVAWRMGTGPPASPRSPLTPGLETLHG